ncbi:MAG: hypothetical protein IPF56_19375 [Chloroflexi bacterium]|nr:hypothetical protein [Chloroflexota bacterium]MBK6712888.1 hypothetical protein [Chloroflexota bacterium]MBK7177508.1 hypothetical protein [Chloroflexota bacterium]MBK8931880.1 hypothetical protein [Chloroflexota bacterium]
MGQTHGRFLRLSRPLTDAGEAARTNKSRLPQVLPRRLAPTYAAGIDQLFSGLWDFMGFGLMRDT